MTRKRYQRLVGRLIYHSHTHQDIGFVVFVARQFMCSIKSKHFEEVDRILSNSMKGLLYGKLGSYWWDPIKMQIGQAAVR